MRLRLPSRNWLIFLSITGSLTTAILYDRHEKKKAQQKWCTFVSHLSRETISPTQMPRKITIFLAAPPGDGLRTAREHFQEYVKPVLVSASLDWDVVEGRREGELRAGLAEKVRKMRQRQGERANAEQKEPSAEDTVHESRQRVGIIEWNGVQGDLVIGRHTWKEYVRGLHEGWLGPLDPPPEPVSQPQTDESTIALDGQDHRHPNDEDGPSDIESTGPKSEIPKKPVGTTPPYLSPSQYSDMPIASTISSGLAPSTTVAFPHILGFLNTPTRIYRFLTRRHLADQIGHDVAAFVVTSDIRPYRSVSTFASDSGRIDPDSPFASSGVNGDVTSDSPVNEPDATIQWEQEQVLEGEEREWHKMARKPNPEGEEGRERVWLEKMILDRRIANRMRTFEMSAEEEERAARIAKGEAGAKDESTIESSGQARKGWFDHLKDWTGLGGDSDANKGWNQGLLGDEND